MTKRSWSVLGLACVTLVSVGYACAHLFPGEITFDANPLRVVEGNDGTKKVELAVTFTAGTIGAQQVQWRTVAGTARPGIDYQEASGTIVFGQSTTRTIELTILGDLEVEPEEAFSVELTWGRGSSEEKKATAQIETVDDGRDGQVLERIVKTSVLEVFRATVPAERLGSLVTAFEDGRVVHTGADVAAADYADLVTSMPGMRDVLAELGVGESPAQVASVVEFVLEGLHLSKRLNKDADHRGTRATYRGR